MGGRGEGETRGRALAWEPMTPLNLNPPTLPPALPAPAPGPGPRLGARAAGGPSDPHVGTGEAHSLSAPKRCGPESPSDKHGPPRTLIRVGGVLPNVGRGKILVFLAVFPFYFLIIFLDDFISKKGVGERERTEGGRTGALSRAEGKGQARGRRAGARGPGKSQGRFASGKAGAGLP